MKMKIHDLLLLPFKLRTQYIYSVQKPKIKFKGKALPVTVTDGRWETRTPLPSFRYEFNAAIVDDEIFLVGGIYLPTVYNVTRTVEAYNFNTDTWRRVKNFPRITHHPGVTSVNNQLYVIGGNGLRIFPYKHNFRYNKKENLWERRKDMRVPRGALGITSYKDYIFVIGGGQNKLPLDTNERYDPKTNTWETMAPMPTPREHLFAASAGGFIFALGGYQRDLTKPFTTNEAYNPKTDKWEKRAPMPRPICGMPAAGIGNSVFVFGGEQGFALSNEIWEYKIKEDKWYRHIDMPTARYAHVAIPENGKVHIIGGNTKLFSHLFSQEHFVYILPK